MFRSRSLARKRLRIPGGELTVHFEKRNPSQAKCNTCGTLLKGVPRKTVDQIKKIGKSVRRPSRPYGGNLCTKCSRELIKQKARENV